MIDRLLPLVARGFVSAVFIRSGIAHCLDLEGTQQFIAQKGLPTSLSLALALGAVFLLLTGGLSILLGFRTRWGALALIFFLIPTTLIFHLDFTQQMEQIQFLKNVSLVGGLLLLVQHGPGPYSFDHQQLRRNYGKW